MAEHGVERGISVRQISNGWIVKETAYDPSATGDNAYQETETFSTTKPEVDVEATNVRGPRQSDSAQGIRSPSRMTGQPGNPLAGTSILP